MSTRKKKKALVPGPRKGPIREVRPRRSFDKKLGDMRCPHCNKAMIGTHDVTTRSKAPKDLRSCPFCRNRVVAVKADADNDLVSFTYEAVPNSLPLPHKAYQRLFKLVRWYQDTPDSVQLPDSAHERITEAIQDFMPEAVTGHATLIDDGDMYVSEVQIEDIRTVRAGHDFTEIDQLVAIIYVEGACNEDEEEQHVPILATL